MGTHAQIEWLNMLGYTPESWNPLTGCTPISAGCEHCWAKAMHERFNGTGSFKPGTVYPHRFQEPLTWRKPRMVAVCLMGDLFHAAVRLGDILKVFETMWSPQCRSHIFCILTKRPALALQFVELYAGRYLGNPFFRNIWFGVTVENQETCGRIDTLLQIPAAVRFVSFEPLLGPIILTPERTKIDWALIGGESGREARSMGLGWARILIDALKRVKVPIFVKQLGQRPHQFREPGEGYHARCLKHPRGADPSEWPADLRIREWPKQKG